MSTESNQEPIFQPYYIRGLITHHCPPDVMDILMNDADDIIANNFNYKNRFISYKLAGAIKNELLLTKKSQDALWPSIEKMANVYCDINQIQNRNNIKYLPEVSNNNLGEVWFNFQKKYEYNPPHTHNGDLSFVLWLKIPYDLKKEIANFYPDINFTHNLSPAKFCFLFPDHNSPGGLALTYIDVDKTYEGKIIMFPSSLNHAVYPFFLDDGYRISVSGNISLR